MRRPAILAVPLLLALVLTGCTGGSDSAETASPSSDAGGSAGDERAAGMAAADALAADPAAPPASETTPATLGRVVPAGASLIRTAELGVRVEDVRAAADRAADIAAIAGGAVTSERSSGQDEFRDASLLLRVPPERFDAVVADLAGLGEEQRRSLGTEDVSDQVVDLESRLSTQRASVERVRALLDQAENLGEVVQIEGELTRRTADLESLQARLAALTERVDMSSISLDLYAGQAPEREDDEVVGFASGLRGGWSAFLATVRVVGATAGALLPFLPFLALGALAWRVRARRTAAPSAP
jgi:hypothetical protein